MSLIKPNSDSFRSYSKYYDLLYQDKDYAGEVAYLLKLLDLYAPNGSIALEFGCGTGHHASILASDKWSIDGVDFSEEMLVAAESRKKTLAPNIAKRMNFYHGDVGSFEIDKQYDVVISLFHVVSYQTTNDEALKMFKNVAKHLKMGGIFVFDYWYGPAVLTERPSIKVKRMQSADIGVVRLAEPVMYPNTSIVDVNFEIHVKNNKTQIHETILETHRMRYFFLNEIELLLKEAGLRMISSSEWLTGAKPGWDTWGVCSVAVK